MFDIRHRAWPCARPKAFVNLPWLSAGLMLRQTHADACLQGVDRVPGNRVVQNVFDVLSVQKICANNNAKKTRKNTTMSLRGSKKTSKTEPKVVSGRGFSDFGQSLISCNTTRVLLDFHGFGLPWGGQKTIKKRLRKINVEKDGPKHFFFKNTCEN